MEEYDVVVIGAGPAGLTAAVALARAGAEVLLVEKRAGGSPPPRATVLSMHTMEVMRGWGLEGAIRADADDVDMTMLEAPTAARAAEGVRVDVGYPTTAQSALLSPTAALCVAQDHLERVLAEHLASLGSATIQRGTELLDVRASAEGATVTVRDPSGSRMVATRYVVGADGAKSRVRAVLGIEMVGSDALLEGVQAEFRAPLWDVVGEHRHLLYALTEPGGTGVLLPAGQGDRWVYGTELAPDSDAPPDLGLDEMRDRIKRAAGVPALDVRIERVGRFSSGAFLAERFSDGPVFLVGDAAHRVTPRGGTGLNIAIADGFNLGWKLGWVLRGWAPESLLSTYEAERRPPVAHSVERSADPMGTRRHAATELAVDLGGRLPHVWVDPFHRSTLDMIGDGLTLFVGSEGSSAWQRAAGIVADALPVSWVPLQPLTARSLGVNPTGALLARPDGVPIAHWWTAADAPGRLAGAVADLLGGSLESASPRSAA